MRTLVLPKFAFLFAISLIIICLSPAYGQGRSWEVMDTASLVEQLNYVHERTLIYENYRAIREDIFQKIRTNAVDSLSAAKGDINDLNRMLASTNSEVDSLKAALEDTKEELDAAIKTKDTLVFLGIQTNKLTYNTIMWSVVIGLATVLVILFLVFKRDHAITSHTRKDLEEIKEAFEAYKTSSRERYEKLVVSHHNEIQKFKDKKMR